jgi:hypothetical protein
VIFDLLAVDIIERTASTARVRDALELSLAPAFLLVGIGSMMNVMMSRLIWLANRIERLYANANDERPLQLSRMPFEEELAWLTMRRRIVRTAVKFSTGAAVIISVVIALLFTSAFVDFAVGALVAGLWVFSVSLLIVGLGCFLREALLAANAPEHESRS